MSSEIFAEWLCRLGHKIVITASSFWVEIGPRIFQAFPYHHVILPSQEELDVLLTRHSAVGLRYSAPWNAPYGVASYHVTFTDHEYPLMSLHKKARHDVSRGVASARIEPISFDRLAMEGWALRVETLQRQGRTGAETPEEWQRLCLSAKGLHGFEAWGAIVNGQLAASLIAFTSADCCSILYQQSRTQYLPLGINNALTFVFTNEALKQPAQPYIFYGLHSLDAPPSVDQFKFRMGYHARPVKQRIEFHPSLRPLFNCATHAAVRAGLWLQPGNTALSKAEGMLRFYLQGRLPLSKQTLPLPLAQGESYNGNPYGVYGYQ
jgi:hypothetical protein